MSDSHVAGLTMLAALALCLGCATPWRSGEAARERGEAAARADVAAGVLKLKEFPPLPYSKQQMDFIRLLKSECGVTNEVVNGPIGSTEIRQEVDSYNAVMRGEISRRFGPDIFEKLHAKAEGK